MSFRDTIELVGNIDGGDRKHYGPSMSYSDMRQINFGTDGIDDVPLSMGIATDEFLFVSGQVSMDLETGEFISGDVRTQTENTIENIRSILSAEGATLDDVVKTTVFLTDISDFDEMNDAYRDAFSEPYPARSAIGIQDLAADIKLEIEAVAQRPE